VVCKARYLMDIKKTLIALLCLTTLIGIVLLLCFKGVKVHHDMDAPRSITVPEGTSTIEIPRRDGKEPFRFNIKTPERKLQIEK
jgi:hypothetical protein